MNSLYLKNRNSGMHLQFVQDKIIKRWDLKGMKTMDDDRLSIHQFMLEETISLLSLIIKWDKFLIVHYVVAGLCIWNGVQKCKRILSVLCLKWHLEHEVNLLWLPPSGTSCCWSDWHTGSFGLNSLNLKYALDINLIYLKGLYLF